MSLMPMQILVTGGAGFVGSHLSDRLLAAGHRVRVLDNLSPQVHGEGAGRPDYLDPEVELQVGDVRDAAACRRALAGVDVVYHLAACVGVGQSMYEIARYTEVNSLGTATLLEAVVATRRVTRLVVASSMSIYGEGLYLDHHGAQVEDAERSIVDLKRGIWEPRHRTGERVEASNGHGHALDPVATTEGKRPDLASIYALSKYDQERLCLLTGRAYGIATVVLRLFNVFGPRQALSNPYTGVLAIFASRLLNERPPLINEDGRQRRDFVSVHDVAGAFVRALDASAAEGLVLNIGSGQVHTVLEVADGIARAVGKPHISPTITGHYRVGDIRHCYADITRARELLGYQPRVTLESGLEELAEWLRGRAPVDRLETARRELFTRGLAI